MLHAVAVGSVDDGKSTLIGRLLYETGHLNADEIAHVEEASRKRGRDEPAQSAASSNDIWAGFELDLSRV